MNQKRDEKGIGKADAVSKYAMQSCCKAKYRKETIEKAKDVAKERLAATRNLYLSGATRRLFLQTTQNEPIGILNKMANLNPNYHL